MKCHFTPTGMDKIKNTKTGADKNVKMEPLYTVSEIIK